MQKSDRLPKYHSCDTIPARIFFEVLKNRDYQQLKPKPKTSADFLNKVFDGIYDEFFVKSGNKDAELFLQLRNDLAEWEYKITFVKRLLAFLLYTPITKEMYIEWIAKLKEKFKIHIDAEKPMLDEIQRVLNRNLGAWNNELNMKKHELEALEKEFEKGEFDFYESVVNLGSALPGNTMVNAQMTLSEYIAAGRIATKQNKKK
jgi:hypothetical protein